MALLATLVIAFSLTCQQAAEQFKNESLKIAFSLDGSWSTIPAATLARINASASQPVIAHAKKLDLPLESRNVVSKILVLQSRLPLDARADNANYLFAIEKPWSDRFEKTGKGYLELMVDRVQKLGAPTKFTLPPKEMKIGKETFYYSEAENTIVKTSKTKQRYICGFARGHYVYFVLSYNDGNDDDFKKMMSCVNSFKALE